MVSPVVFQIAGFQNSGKTTFMTKLIKELSIEKHRVATIKHHGHGGKPDVIKNKDSSKHAAAGAEATLVEGEGSILLHAENTTLTLKDQIALLSFFNPDVILIEGHKKAEFEKAVIIRDDADLPLIKGLENIKLILCRDSQLALMLAEKQNIPVFSMGNDSGLHWLLHYLKSRIIANRNSN
ncbi:molybdopterin-guanine dinucleotide biosynthesis protein B [Bacillus methanolicus PB1]|uniref:Molybdopterin-guanine dinucleotide biosynthesis protein B n=1 Tax=Bacillus methanolicus PB1 TaxID=997296 RepID=I3E5V6_BACMT|nr:molybdopterin-guanine dinucleotide biosynthesis protein B [Bacillus methanolicus PB1]